MEYRQKTPQPKFAGVIIELSPQLNARLEEISSQYGITKIEIMSRAFALFDVAIAAKEKNERVGIIDQNGNLAREIIGLM